MKWQSSFTYILHIALITRKEINHILGMACNLFSGIICYVMIYLYYSGQTRDLSSLHIKIPEPRVDGDWLAATHFGDGLPTFSCPATTALPCQDSKILLRRLPLASLGEPTRPGGCPNLALERVTTSIKFMFYTCPAFYI